MKVKTPANVTVTIIVSHLASRKICFSAGAMGLSATKAQSKRGSEVRTCVEFCDTWKVWASHSCAQVSEPSVLAMHNR